jgi:hypothetical protein
MASFYNQFLVELFFEGRAAAATAIEESVLGKKR